MSLKTKLGDTWKEAKSLHVKVNGEWKDISKLYSKKDGAWFVVFSGGGAIIEFLDYPYAIPVMKGWEYSTDGKNWTTVSDENLRVIYGELPYDFSAAHIIPPTSHSGDGPRFELGDVTINDDSEVAKVDMTFVYAEFDIVTLYNASFSVDVFREIVGGEKIHHSYQDNYLHWETTDTSWEVYPDFESTGYGIVSMVVYDSSGNVIQTLDDDVGQPIASFYELTGKVGDWDFSTLYWYSEAYNGGWYQIILPSGSTPIIDKVIFTNESGTSVEITGVIVNQNLAYPIEGTGLDLGFITSTLDPVLGGTCTLDFYAGETYVGSFTGGPFGTIGNVGYVEGKFMSPPFTGYVKVKGELSLSEYYNETDPQNFTTGDWDLSGATFKMNSAFGGVTVLGIVGTTPAFGSMLFYAEDSDYLNMYPAGQELLPQHQSSYNTDGANGVYYTSGTMWMNSSNRSATLLGTDGTPIARWSEVPDIQMAHIPVTEGSTYTLAATVTSTGDWDMSNAAGVATAGNACTISGITGSTPAVAKLVMTAYSIEFEFAVSNGDPNGKYVNAGFPAGGYNAESITLYDASGNIIASTVPFEHNASGTASVSEVLTFDSPVTGTINYVAGDLLPSVQITVTDDSGNVIEGAEITIEEYNDWDLSKVELYPNGALRNVTGSVPPIDTLRFTGSSSGVQTLDVVGKDITGLISFIGTSGVFGTTLTFTRGESMSIELICNGTTVASNTITVMTFNWEHSGGGNN